MWISPSRLLPKEKDGSVLLLLKDCLPIALTGEAYLKSGDESPMATGSYPGLIACWPSNLDAVANFG